MTEIDWENGPFKAEDFSTPAKSLTQIGRERAAKCANARFQELLKDAETVLFPSEEEQWLSEREANKDYPWTHSAKLVMVKKLK